MLTWDDAERMLCQKMHKKTDDDYVNIMKKVNSNQRSTYTKSTIQVRSPTVIIPTELLHNLIRDGDCYIARDLLHSTLSLDIVFKMEPKGDCSFCDALRVYIGV